MFAPDELLPLEDQGELALPEVLGVMGRTPLLEPRELEPIWGVRELEEPRAGLMEEPRGGVLPRELLEPRELLWEPLEPRCASA